jgi:hypothetical protein
MIMKNYLSKSFISALILCSTVNIGLQAAEAPINVGYESSTPFAMPTYQAQPAQLGGTPSAPQQSGLREVETGNAIKRGIIRGFLLPEIAKGYIHKWTGGNTELLQDEERIEFITTLITTIVLEQTVLARGNISASTISTITHTLAQSYPLINASTIESIVISLAPAIIQACVTEPGTKAGAFVETLAFSLANVLAAKKMAARQEADPSIEA